MGILKEDTTKYYSANKLWETDASYMIPYGVRSNGKSYAFRGKVLEDFRDNGNLFVYLRRWDIDIKPSAVEQYFNIEQIIQIFNGKYDCVICRQNEIWLGHYDEELGKQVKDVVCGYYCALNMAEHYKSWSKLEQCKTILFEEFITNRLYLQTALGETEPEMLMHFVSTCFRLNKGRVVLIGNNISQICPYWEFFLGSKENVKKVFSAPPGSIDIYNVHNGEDGTVKIAIENCNVVKYNNTMFIGNAQKQIVRGEWEVNTCNKRPKGKWENLFCVTVSFLQFNFNLLLQINEDGERIVFVYPSDKIEYWLYTDRFITNNHTKPKIDGVLPFEKIYRELYANNKFCFSDDLTGTNFKTLLTQYKFI